MKKMIRHPELWSLNIFAQIVPLIKTFLSINSLHNLFLLYYTVLYVYVLRNQSPNYLQLFVQVLNISEILDSRFSSKMLRVFLITHVHCLQNDTVMFKLPNVSNVLLYDKFISKSCYSVIHDHNIHPYLKGQIIVIFLKYLNMWHPGTAIFLNHSSILRHKVNLKLDDL